MLREIKNVRQRKEEANRRWFTSSEMDVYVWEDSAHGLVGFQVTYDKPLREKALTWRLGEDLSHSSVLVDGPVSGRHPGSPILTHDEHVDAWYFCGRLLRQTGELDKEHRDTICRRVLASFGDE